MTTTTSSRAQITLACSGISQISSVVARFPAIFHAIRRVWLQPCVIHTTTNATCFTMDLQTIFRVCVPIETGTKFQAPPLKAIRPGRVR